jgi:hypothetical protein
MPEEIIQESGSRIPSDSEPLAGNLSPAQRQFAEVLGSCLAEQWRRIHTAPQKGEEALTDNGRVGQDS